METINPFSSDAKQMRIKRLSVDFQAMLDDCPNFHQSGSPKYWRTIYGKGALMVRCGYYVYNVTLKPEIYFDYAKY